MEGTAAEEPPQKIPAEDQNLESIEATLFHEEIMATLHSALPILLLVFGALFVPWLSSIARVSILLALGGFAYYLSAIQTILKTDDYKKKRDYATMFSFVMYVVRILCSLWCWALHPNSILLKLGTLYVLPLSAVRNAQNKRHFMVYLVCHLLISVLRYKSDPEGGYQIILTSFINARFLSEIAAQKELQRRTRLDLALASTRAVAMAKATALHLLDGFCDAVVSLSPDLRLLEPSKRLESLIGRSAPQDKLFLDFVNPNDLEEFEDHMGQVRDVIANNCSAPTSTKEFASATKIQARSFAVHLDGPYNEPIPMHLFHSCIQGFDQEVVFFIGISEAWVPKVSKAERSSRGQRGRSGRGSVARFDFNSSKWVPSTPLFAESDERQIRAYKQKHIAEEKELGAFLNPSGQPSLRQRRNDSPRPHPKNQG